MYEPTQSCVRGIRTRKIVYIYSVIDFDKEVT